MRYCNRWADDAGTLAKKGVQHHQISLDLALEVYALMILRFNLEDDFAAFVGPLSRSH